MGLCLMPPYSGSQRDKTATILNAVGHHIRERKRQREREREREGEGEREVVF